MILNRFIVSGIHTYDEEIVGTGHNWSKPYCEGIASKQYTRDNCTFQQQSISKNCFYNISF